MMAVPEWITTTIHWLVAATVMLTAAMIVTIVVVAGNDDEAKVNSRAIEAIESGTTDQNTTDAEQDAALALGAATDATHNASIDALDTRVTDLESADATYNTSLDALDTRVAALESADAGSAGYTCRTYHWGNSAWDSGETYTFDVPSNTTFMHMIVVGAGGGGASCYTADADEGAGGGGGAWIELSLHDELAGRGLDIEIGDDGRGGQPVPLSFSLRNGTDGTSTIVTTNDDSSTEPEFYIEMGGGKGGSSVAGGGIGGAGGLPINPASLGHAGAPGVSVGSLPGDDQDGLWRDGVADFTANEGGGSWGPCSYTGAQQVAINRYGGCGGAGCGTEGVSRDGGTGATGYVSIRVCSGGGIIDMTEDP